MMIAVSSKNLNLREARNHLRQKFALVVVNIRYSVQWSVLEVHEEIFHRKWVSESSKEVQFLQYIVPES